jgi:hypothetical protein
MVVKVGIGAGGGLAIDDVFRFKAFAVGRQDELGLVSAGGSTLPQRGEGRRHFAFRADLEMDVVALEHRAGQIRLVRVSTLEPFKGSLLVAESFEESIRKSRRVEGRFRKPGDGFFYFDCVHANTAFMITRRIEPAEPRQGGEHAALIRGEHVDRRRLNRSGIIADREGDVQHGCQASEQDLPISAASDCPVTRACRPTASAAGLGPVSWSWQGVLGAIGVT